MAVKESKTETGVDLKAEPTATGDAGSESKSHLHNSRDMNRGGSAGSVIRRGGQKGASMDRAQTHKAAAAPFPSRVRVKQSELIFFTTQLAVMLDSGVVLSDALDAIAEQSNPGAFKMIIEGVAGVVKSGQSFSTSLAPYPRVFNPMFISMVKVSEASGKMVEMLRVLSEYLSFEEETKRRVKGALTYPMIMAIMAIVAVGVMMFFVLPKFVGIYEAKGAALPKITQMLLSLSAVMADGRKMMGLVTVLLLTSVAIHYWLGTVRGRRVIDFVKIRIPVLGTMFVTLMVTRSMRIMATMINTGVNLLEAIEVIRGSCNNYYFQRLWSTADKGIRDGYQLSDSIEIATQRGHVDVSGARELRNRTLNALVDPGIIHMLRAGEKSGQLGQVSDKISVFYGKKLEISIKSVTALVEPLMIVVIGTIIGIVAIALLLPVLKISSVIAH
ncbi:putative type II secretion system protein F [subsurface metagenome]